MTERQPDERLIDHIGFQPPPHRIEASRGPVAILLAKAAVALLLLIAIALPSACLASRRRGKLA